MKKLLGLLAAFMVVLTLAGCAKEEPTIDKTTVTGTVTYVGNDRLFISSDGKTIDFKLEYNELKLKVGDIVTLDYIQNEIGQEIVFNKDSGHLEFVHHNGLYNNTIGEITKVTHVTPLEKDLYYNGKTDDGLLVFIDYEANNYYMDEKSLLSNYKIKTEFSIGEKINFTYLAEEKIDNRVFLRDVFSALNLNNNPTLGFTVIGMDENGTIVIDGVSTTKYYVKGLTGLTIGDTILSSYDIKDELVNVTHRYSTHVCQVLELKSPNNLVVEADDNKINYDVKVVDSGSDYVIVELDSKYYELIPENGYKFDFKDYKLADHVTFEASVIDPELESTLTYNGNEVGIIKGVYYLRVK